MVYYMYIKMLLLDTGVGGLVRSLNQGVEGVGRFELFGGMELFTAWCGRNEVFHRARC